MYLIQKFEKSRPYEIPEWQKENVKNYSTVITTTAICNVNTTHGEILQQRTLRHGNLMPNLIYFHNAFKTERCNLQ